MRSQAGFTLVELSVVLLIISIVAMLGVDLGRNAVRVSDRVTTQDRLTTVKAALDNYMDRNGYLPCPADPALASTAGAYASENRSGTVGAGCSTTGGVVSSGGVFMGMLPARTLNLGDQYAMDAWGSKLLYAVSAPLVGNSSYGLGGAREVSGTIIVRAGTRAANYTVSTLPTGHAGAGAAYLVLSHGANKRGAYPADAATIPLACGNDATAIDVANCDRSDAVFFDSGFNDGNQAATRFDDFLIWGTNMAQYRPQATALGPGSCTGSCEAWCAPCTYNIGAPTKSFLCQKYLMFTMPACNATCVWSGGDVPCP